MADPVLPDAERDQVVAFLRKLDEFTLEARDRREFVRSAGLGKFVGDIAWAGTGRAVAGELVDFLNTAGFLADNPSYHALGRLLAYCLGDPRVGLGDATDLATLIVGRGLVRDPVYIENLRRSYNIAALPPPQVHEQAARSVSVDAARIRAGLREGRAARRAAAGGAAAPPEPYAIGDDAVWGYDLIPQENAFRTPFFRMPRHGVFAYTACDNPQLLETYVAARMEHCLRDDMRRTLSPDKKARIVLTEADLANPGQALAVVNRLLRASGRKELPALVARKGPDCFLTILNWNARSALVQPFMAALTQQIAAELGPTLQKNNLFLIIFWIDIGQGTPSQVALFASVPPVDPIDDADSVVGWLESVLSGAGLAGTRRKAVLNRLRSRLNSPIPWDVYEALRATVDDLRGGRI